MPRSRNSELASVDCATDVQAPMNGPFLSLALAVATWRHDLRDGRIVIR